MRYHQKLEVVGEIVDAMEELCRGDSGEGRDIEFDQSVNFGNGYIMDIQVCKGDDGYWTQGVLYALFTKSQPAFLPGDGYKDIGGYSYIEVDCSYVGENFEGEYRVLHDGDEYVGEIVRKGVA